MADSTVCVFGLVSNVSAVELTSFLESLTRTKAVAQCKIQEERRSAGRFWALVQFKTGDDALLAIQLGQSGSLTFNGCRLKICQDTEGRSRGAVEEIIVNDVVLHAGCLTQSDVLHRLFKRRGCDVVVSGEKFSIIVYDTEHGSVYKLEWWISEIFELSRCKRKGRVHDIFPLFSCGGTSRFDTFILRVWLAPRIFQYKPDPDYYVCEGFFGFPLDRFCEPTWLRIGDFSSKASIGQSYVYCLQCSWQFSGNLEHLINKNPHLSVQHRKLSIHVGHHYCASVQSVPILGSAHLQQLPFEIIFSVNSLVQQGYLSGPGLDSSFLFCLRPSQEKSKSHILHVLENFKRLEDTCFEPEKWFQEESEKILGQSERDKLVHHQPDDKLLYVRKVLVTPTRVYFTGPEIELSNRVTRHFKEHIDDFLRISFVEEDHDTLYPSAFEVPEARCLEEDRGHMYKRVIKILRDGISIGNKVFKFLAFSSSQLKEHSAWMFAANNKITADDIRNWMGDFFSIRNVAKCAARMGQSFSSSRSSWDVSRNEIEEIDDIWDMKRMYCFSDGVGKISASFATQVAKKCKFRTVPSLYQIRYGGFKGVVAVDLKSSYKLSLRPTMEKFPSSLTGLDILDHSHALPCYLNREIITILSTLGVEDTIFETMQKHQICHMDAVLNDAAVALDVVQSYSGGHTANEIFEGMLLRGFHPTAEPFLKRMLHCFRASHLTNLCQKARIFVPKGRLLMGCMDETRTLNYGEVFISVSPIRKAYRIVEDGLRFGTVNGINNIDQTVAIIEGRVIVARNPCVHPGDIRVLRAVNVPSLHHLVDCVVFPQKGHRPHPSECSGGDLDGDKYFVSWDARLIPSEVCKPQDYQSESGQELQRPVNTQDIIKHFADFMLNNGVGIISSAHVVHADKSEYKAYDPKCLKLAKQCSVAADFAKTGIPAEFPKDLKPTSYPDFMQKTDKPSYKSRKVLGTLFRAVTEPDKEVSLFTNDEAVKFYDKQLEFPGFQKYLREARALRDRYNSKLRDLMHRYDLRTEADIFTGRFQTSSKFFQKDPEEVKQSLLTEMSSLRREARCWLENEVEGKNANMASDEELKKASAWYHVTYYPDYVPDHVGDKYGHLLSFPWVVYDKLARIKQGGRYRSC